MILNKQIRPDPVRTARPKGGLNWRHAMVEERTRRRPGFSREMPLCLADRQEWWVPAPGALRNPAATAVDQEYELIVAWVACAEDEAELSRAELALGIYLLDRNYRLGPDDFARLLEVPPGTHQSEAVRAAFRRVAAVHVPRQRIDEAAATSPGPAGWRGLISRCASLALGR